MMSMMLGTSLTFWKSVFSKTLKSKLEKLDFEAGIPFSMLAVRASPSDGGYLLLFRGKISIYCFLLILKGDHLC